MEISAATLWFKAGMSYEIYVMLTETLFHRSYSVWGKNIGKGHKKQLEFHKYKTNTSIDGARVNVLSCVTSCTATRK